MTTFLCSWSTWFRYAALHSLLCSPITKYGGRGGARARSVADIKNRSQILTYYCTFTHLFIHGQQPREVYSNIYGHKQITLDKNGQNFRPRRACQAMFIQMSSWNSGWISGHAETYISVRVHVLNSLQLQHEETQVEWTMLSIAQVMQSRLRMEMKKVHELVKLPIFANIDLVLWFAVYWTASTLSMLTAVPCTLSVWPRPRWLYSIYMSSANQDGAWNSLWRYLSIRHCVESRPCTYILQTDPGLPVPTSQCPLHTVHAVPSVLVVLGSIIALARWFRRPVNLNVQYVHCTMYI